MQRLPNTRAALAYAEQVHAGQRRAVDGAPFIVHPLEVAGLLYCVGAPDHVIAAGVLHDAIEKTNADAADLKTRFGSSITTIVLAVSEDPRIIGYEERKAALRNQIGSAGDDALMVLAADKIFQIQEDPGGGGLMLVAVTDQGYGVWTDTVGVNCKGHVSGAEGDQVTFYGTVVGSKTYDTQIRGTTYVPEVDVKYVTG